MALRAWLRALLCIAAVFLTSQAALGDSPTARYGGVAPGKSTAAPPPQRGAWTNLTWVGFLPNHEGGARVFAQLGREVSVEQTVHDGALWVMLERVRPATRNATRPLDVRFFDTSLATIQVTRSSRRAAGRDGTPAQPDGTKIVVTFKDPADAREAEISVVREEDGYHYLYLDF